MPKKPAAKTKNKTVAPIKAAAKKKMQKTITTPANGMWKILEMKQAQQKQHEQNGRDVRPNSNQNQVLQPFSRNTRFAKFAGHRRKVG